jgi:hypothetical protein
LYFQGDAPSVGVGVFQYYNDGVKSWEPTTVYYLPGTSGWPIASLGVREALWNPQVQTTSASLGVKAGQFGFKITATNNFTVVVEASPSLANATWTPLATNTLSSGPFYFSDPQWTNYPARFYRLHWP